MSRFFFDCFDGSHWVQDNLGVECPSLEKAVEEAQEILPEIARENLPVSGSLNLKIRIRDESGVVVGEAALDFASKPVP